MKLQISAFLFLFSLAVIGCGGSSGGGGGGAAPASDKKDDDKDDPDDEETEIVKPTLNLSGAVGLARLAAGSSLRFNLAGEDTGNLQTMDEEGNFAPAIEGQFVDPSPEGRYNGTPISPVVDEIMTQGSSIAIALKEVLISDYTDKDTYTLCAVLKADSSNGELSCVGDNFAIAPDRSAHYVKQPVKMGTDGAVFAAGQIGGYDSVENPSKLFRFIGSSKTEIGAFAGQGDILLVGTSWVLYNKGNYEDSSSGKATLVSQDGATQKHQFSGSSFYSTVGPDGKLYLENGSNPVVYDITGDSETVLTTSTVCAGQNSDRIIATDSRVMLFCGSSIQQLYPSQVAHAAASVTVTKVVAIGEIIYAAGGTKLIKYDPSSATETTLVSGIEVSALEADPANNRLLVSGTQGGHEVAGFVGTDGTVSLQNVGESVEDMKVVQ